MIETTGWKTEEELQAIEEEEHAARRVAIAADPTVVTDSDVYELLPGFLTRGHYEAICRSYQIDPATDTDCDTYGVKYGDFHAAAREYRVDMALRRLRQNGIRRERPAQQPHHRSSETGTCSNCGNGVTKTMAMAGSLGTLCPDCYDTVEAEL